MDLSLRGSQISLVARQKSKKPKSCHLLGHPPPQSLNNSRPQSATPHFFSRRSRSSPFLSRPQSADPKFRRASGSSFCGHYLLDADLRRAPPCAARRDRRLQSVSSSDLLKQLLDEPIRRSWLCRGSAPEVVSSPDPDPSELSSFRRCPSSLEGDVHCSARPPRHPLAQPSRRTPLPTSAFTAAKMSKAPTAVSEKRSFSAPSRAAAAPPPDYWSRVAFAKTPKPDLPGRVSFSKPSASQDLDSSDCDNDKQAPYDDNDDNDDHLRFCRRPVEDSSISAPGPVSAQDFARRQPGTPPATDADTGSSGLKKSVHFGASGGAEVLAETYEYPKCPSENCSCSTRSSSTASLHEAADTRCACDAPTCRYTGDVQASAKDKEAKSKEKAPSPVEDLPVIREYKNAVGEQLANSVVKNLLDEPATTTTTTTPMNMKAKPPPVGMLNNLELPPYLGKYSADALLEQQNNLAQVAGANAKNPTSYKSATKRSLELVQTKNDLEQNSGVLATYGPTSETVINNYLKVVASAAPLAPKKKENNNKSSSHDAVGPDKRPKALGPKLLARDRGGRSKKATSSYGNMREDSNLNEFHLDKVDSWMAMHEQAMMSRKAVVPRTGSGSGSVSGSGSGSGSRTTAVLEDDFERFAKESNDDGEEDAPDSASQLSTKSDDNSNSKSNSQDDSTYDEIVSVIKEIEEDKKQDNYAERAPPEMQLRLDGTPPDSSPAPATQRPSEKGRQDPPSQSQSQPQAQSTPDKYKDILNYLDNVEDSCDKTLLETRRSIPESNRSEIEFVVEPDIAEDVPKLADLLMLPNHQLARRVVALSLRANELANAVHLAKEHVAKVRAEKQKSVRAEKANAAGRMRDQKKHYETVVARHQGFIEQLLKDKGSLCEKVAALTRRLESQNQAWEHKLETEVQRVKETTLAGEKIRRERWVRENTKKIKELTVKGLEMEIDKMSASHQREVTELKRAHQQELLDALEEARLKHEQVENSIRESCAQDREAIIEKERAAIRERFERQLEEERRSWDEQRAKLCEEFAVERERLQAELRDKELDFQARRQETMREKEHEMEEALAELREKMAKQDEKYQNRINTIEKQYEADFGIWKKEHENATRLQQAEKENAIRQHYRAERDRQIDAIVSRMDAEALKSAEEFEAKISRAKEKHEKDLQEAEAVERALREKYTDARSRLAEADAQVRNHQAELKQLQIELGHSKKMCGEFLAERDRLRENLREEIQTEVATLKAERDNEIQRIHKRVQQAIEKKDATIELLQKENGSLRERCLKLEAIIRQQRKDYCVK